MFNFLRQDRGGISPRPRGNGNFCDDEIVSCAPANVASEVGAFKSLIFQSNTNATAKSRSLRLAASISFLISFLITRRMQTHGVKMLVKIRSKNERGFFRKNPIDPLVRTLRPFPEGPVSLLVEIGGLASTVRAK